MRSSKEVAPTHSHSTDRRMNAWTHAHTHTHTYTHTHTHTHTHLQHGHGPAATTARSSLCAPIPPLHSAREASWGGRRATQLATQLATQVPFPPRPLDAHPAGSARVSAPATLPPTACRGRVARMSEVPGPPDQLPFWLPRGPSAPCLLGLVQQQYLMRAHVRLLAEPLLFLRFLLADQWPHPPARPRLPPMTRHQRLSWYSCCCHVHAHLACRPFSWRRWTRHSPPCYCCAWPPHSPPPRLRHWGVLPPHRPRALHCGTPPTAQPARLHTTRTSHRLLPRARTHTQKQQSM